MSWVTRPLSPCCICSWKYRLRIHPCTSLLPGPWLSAPAQEGENIRYPQASPFCPPYFLLFFFFVQPCWVSFHIYILHLLILYTFALSCFVEPFFPMLPWWPLWWSSKCQGRQPQSCPCQPQCPSWPPACRAGLSGCQSSSSSHLLISHSFSLVSISRSWAKLEFACEQSPHERCPQAVALPMEWTQSRCWSDEWEIASGSPPGQRLYLEEMDETHPIVLQQIFQLMKHLCRLKVKLALKH